MAGVLVDFTCAETSIAATVTKTMIQAKNAANHRFKLIGFQVSFDGVSGTSEPLVCELCRVNSTGGDGTSSGLTGLKRDGSLPETVQTSGLSAFTAEPTTSNVLKRFEVHPQGGYEYLAPYGQEYAFGGSTAGADSGRCSIRVISPSGAATVNCVATLSIEE